MAQIIASIVTPPVMEKVLGMLTMEVQDTEGTVRIKQQDKDNIFFHENPKGMWSMLLLLQNSI